MQQQQNQTKKPKLSSSSSSSSITPTIHAKFNKDGVKANFFVFDSSKSDLSTSINNNTVISATVTVGNEPLIVDIVDAIPEHGVIQPIRALLIKGFQRKNVTTADGYITATITIDGVSVSQKSLSAVRLSFDELSDDDDGDVMKMQTTRRPTKKLRTLSHSNR